VFECGTDAAENVRIRTKEHRDLVYFADWTGTENGETSALSGRESMLSTRDSVRSAFLDETNRRVQTYCLGSPKGNCELSPEGAGIEGVKVAAFEEGFFLFAYALDQIGLRLEAQRALVEMLVVDHVEKTPTEN